MTEATPTPSPLLSEDPSAWEELVESLNPSSLLVVIESRMSALLRGRLAAEDVLQESLLHAWRDRQQFRWEGPKAFRAWLLRIIDHRIHDAADRERALKRGGGVRPMPLTGPVGGAVPAAIVRSTTPSRLAMHREQAAAMAGALESLPMDVREVVRLRLFEQVSVEEIAGRLGIGVAAVRHRFRRGAAQFRREMLTCLASQSQGTERP